MEEWVCLGKDDFNSSVIFFAAFLCLPFLPSVSDCKQRVKQRKGQVSVRFPVKIQDNGDDVCESETGHNSIEVLLVYFFIIIFLNFVPFFVHFPPPVCTSPSSGTQLIEVL